MYVLKKFSDPEPGTLDPLPQDPLPFFFSKNHLPALVRGPNLVIYDTWTPNRTPKKVSGPTLVIYMPWTPNTLNQGPLTKGGPLVMGPRKSFSVRGSEV